MYAELVCDGTGVLIPEAMGRPKADQMLGTVPERLVELCGRVCYDSLGQGRGSEGYHAHIREAGHLSVCRHAAFTVGFEVDAKDTALVGVQTLLNRKGVWLEMSPDWTILEVTINLQAVIEWDRYSRGINNHIAPMTRDMGDVFRWHAHRLAPMIVPPPRCNDALAGTTFVKTFGLSDDQAFVSVFMSGSRGFSHEQVRHGSYAVSQRSTRYCDEDGTPWVEHPLIAAFLADTAGRRCKKDLLRMRRDLAVEHSRTAYRVTVENLEAWLTGRGIDKATARKQARGAARGYLGNALNTELIFTATVSGWKDMLRQRASRFADAEIREVYGPVLGALRSSQYGDRFEDVVTVPSPDGLGTVLAP